jgi:hypothetical protein
MITDNPEKRKGQRIQTTLPVLMKNAQGITRDVSASGVYFWVPQLVCAPGDLIAFAVELSRPGGKMILKCQGDVVRTEPHAADTGIAVRIIESAMELA